MIPDKIIRFLERENKNESWNEFFAHKCSGSPTVEATSLSLVKCRFESVSEYQKHRCIVKMDERRFEEP